MYSVYFEPPGPYECSDHALVARVVREREDAALARGWERVAGSAEVRGRYVPAVGFD